MRKALAVWLALSLRRLHITWRRVRRSGPLCFDRTAAYGHSEGRQLSDWPMTSASTSDSSIDAMISGGVYMRVILRSIIS